MPVDEISECEAGPSNRTACHYVPHTLSCVFLFSSLITPLPFVPCSVILSPLLFIFALVFSIHYNVQARLPAPPDRLLAFLTFLTLSHTLVSATYFVLVYVVHSFAPSFDIYLVFHLVAAVLFSAAVNCTGVGLPPELAEPRWELFCETFGLRKLGNALSSFLVPLRDLFIAFVGAATVFCALYASRAAVPVAGLTERTPLLGHSAEAEQFTLPPHCLSGHVYLSQPNCSPFPH
ncbi:hypothetical protein JCM8097_003862 [Rhodosporidiobolus ruineniae]